jgi:cell division protein FtsB
VRYALDNKNFLADLQDLRSQKICDFLFLNINILILYYVSMQSEIDIINLLRQCIIKFEAENVKIKAENDKIIAENSELKARIAKLEDMQTQNELIKNLLSVSQKILT